MSEISSFLLRASSNLHLKSCQSEIAFSKDTRDRRPSSVLVQMSKCAGNTKSINSHVAKTGATCIFRARPEKGNNLLRPWPNQRDIAVQSYLLARSQKKAGFLALAFRKGTPKFRESEFDLVLVSSATAPVPNYQILGRFRKREKAVNLSGLGKIVAFVPDQTNYGHSTRNLIELSGGEGKWRLFVQLLKNDWKMRLKNF